MFASVLPEPVQASAWKTCFVVLPVSEEHRFCGQCGDEVSPGDRFCRSCGHEVGGLPPTKPDVGNQQTPDQGRNAQQAKSSVGKRSSALIASAVAGGALVFSGVLPWATATAVFVGTIHRSGFESAPEDAVTVAVLGALGALLSMISRARRQGRGIPIFIAVLGCLVTTVGIYDVSSVSDWSRKLSAEEGFVVSANVGAGLWMVVLFGIVMVLGGFISATSSAQGGTRRKPPE